MAFSASEAAFEGFRIIRREPKTIAIWAGVQLVFSAAISAVTLPIMHSLSVVATLPPTTGGAATASSAAQLATVSTAGLLYLVLLPIYLVVFSVLGAAVYRSVLRPEDGGFGRVKLGSDELRLAGLWILLGLLGLAFSLAVILVVGGLAAGMVLAGRSSGAAAGWIALLLLLIYLACFIGYCWLAVRLSLAGPMTFAQRRINLFGSWRLTKGRFWSLFGCYLLAAIFGVLIGMVELAIVGVVNLGASGGSFTNAATALTRPNFSSYAAYFSVARIISLIIAAPFGAVFWALLIAPAAVAYKEIAGPRPEDQAEAFA